MLEDKKMLEEEGLTPLIGVIIILTLTMAVGAVIAATISGSPRPTLPMSTALHATDLQFQNLEAGDSAVALSNEWGQQLSDAVKITGTTTAGYDFGADIPDDFWAGPTESATVTVSSESGLQNQVSDTETGEVIGIDSDITLSSDLNITDANETIVSKTSTRQTIETGANAIDVEADGVSIKGLEIVGQNDQDSSTTDKGIRLRGNRSDVDIENNVIRGCWEPIIFNSTSTSHTSITIANNDLSGEWIGIMAFTVNNSTIRNNYIHDIGTGIQMSIYKDPAQSTPTNNVIERNTFERVDVGDIEWCYGLLLQAKDTKVRYNEFVGGGEFGVLVTDSITAYGTGDRDISGNKINYNSIYGHSEAEVAETEDYYANLSPSDYTVDATNNWWGTTDGSEIDGMVMNDVDYNPWLMGSAGSAIISSKNLYWGINGVRLDMKGKVISGGEQVSTAGPHDLEPGDMIAGALTDDAGEIVSLEHGDLFFVGWKPRQVPLIEMQIQ